MADDSSLQSFLRRHWEEYKEFWGERFSFLDNFSRFVNRDKPLPSWSASNVEEFIASDPVHGPTLFSSCYFLVESKMAHYGVTWCIGPIPRIEVSSHSIQTHSEVGFAIFTIFPSVGP
ncbi:hypothetical protein UlMin_016753 [Ulmus minor]